jgi:hypothetical protein
MAALGPIIIHSQNMNSIKALDEYFESPCVQYIEKVRTDGRNLYIDFKPMNNREKIREFITPNFVLKYNGEIFYFTHQFYDV